MINTSEKTPKIIEKNNRLDFAVEFQFFYQVQTDLKLHKLKYNLFFMNVSNSVSQNKITKKFEFIRLNLSVKQGPEKLVGVDATSLI